MQYFKILGSHPLQRGRRETQADDHPAAAAVVFFEVGINQFGNVGLDGE